MQPRLEVNKQTRGRRLRVCLVSEALAGVADEGTKKFAHQLVRYLGELCDVCAVAVGAPAPALEGAAAVPVSRTFLRLGLLRRVRHFDPDIVCYLPTAALTLSASLRARVLARFAHAQVALIALQQREHGAIAGGLMRLARPDLVFVQSRSHAARISAAGCRVTVLPPAVDSEQFHPIGAEEKRRLRDRYGLPRDAFIVLHVGHMKRKRNVEVLAAIARSAEVVFVAGESMGAEPELHRQLEAAGVRVFGGFVESIEHLYQAADCFVFPVLAADGAIELPLSVLEAMATNLPIMTTRFGGLPELIDACPGLRYVDTQADLEEALADRGWMRETRTRDAMLPFSWPSVAAAVFREFEGLVRAPQHRPAEVA